MYDTTIKPRRYFLIIVLLIALSGCGGGGSSGGNSVPDGLSDYIGTWVANCTTDWPTHVFTLSINDSGQYFLISNEYDSAANCGNDANLLNTNIDTATVTSIETNANNASYKDIYLSVIETRKTPQSSSEASDWISQEYCGQTLWLPGMEATFNASNTGSATSICYQPNLRPAALLNGSTLSINGRGSFDGGDPPDVVYSKQASLPLLSGVIDDSPWVMVSGKASPDFGAGSLSYSMYDTYVPDTDICNGFFGGRDKVLAVLPDTGGNFTLNLGTYSVTLFDVGNNDNYIILSGSGTLQNVTSTEVSGNMSMSYDGNNHVSGQFTVSRCSN
ncbi:MAG: hypothetical protein PVJ39_03795 [Gammaproteobacteria bacterium]|jgi:hypothetical protein